MNVNQVNLFVFYKERIFQQGIAYCLTGYCFIRRNNKELLFPLVALSVLLIESCAVLMFGSILSVAGIFFYQH